MRTRSLASLIAFTVLVPLFAHARAPARPRSDKGRIGATRQGVADALNKIGFVPPNATLRYVGSGVRVQTRIDKSHFQFPHQHILGHTPRLVTWQVPAVGISGTAKSDTLLLGGNGLSTTVTDLKPNPPPWARPSP